MQSLANPFTHATRELFRYEYACYECGENGSRSGGLELNHITGRDSASPFNASILCKECHAHVGHTQVEEAKLFLITQKLLYTKRYTVTEEDLMFVANHPRLVTEEYRKWLQKNL